MGSGNISLPLLDRIDVASPCPARWEDMVGDDRVRRCAQCNLNVHNLSAMSREEAQVVLAKLAEGRVCVQFWRRADGTILTEDCLVGVARARAMARRALRRFAALIGLVGVAGVSAAVTSETSWGDRLRLRALKPYNTICEWIAPTATPPAPTGYARMAGDVCIMPPPAPPTPQGQGTATPTPGGKE